MKKLSTLLFLSVSIWAQAQIPTNGLLQWFTFDSTLINSTGTDTLEGGAGNYVANRCGVANTAQSLSATAYTFSNAGIGYLPAGSAARSIAFWYKSETNTTHSLFNYGTVAGYMGIVYDGSQLFISGGSVDVTTPLQYSNNWIHVVATYGAGVASLYVNGTLASSANCTISTGVSPTTSRLGHSPFSGEYSGYTIDDLLIYNRALSPQEVTDIYNTDQGAVITTQPRAASAILCMGDTVLLNVGATGPSLTYQWQVNGNDIANGNNNSVAYTPNKAGVYDFTVNVGSSCGSITSNAATVNVYDIPTPSIVQTGADLATQGYDTYQWRLNGVDIPGANGPNYTATQNGAYTVAVTASGVGCVGVSPAVTVVGVGINETETFKAAIYPNPAKDVLMIQSGEEIAGLEIYNMLGEKVKAVNGQVTQVNIASFNAGVYSVRLITTGGLQAVKTFVKQ